MSFVLQRQPVSAQIVAFLQQQIAAGAWGEWLPTERRLAESLQVSRNTLRGALRQLESKGVLKAEHGLGNRILARPVVKRIARTGERRVTLLSPEPLEQMRPTQTLWIDELRALLIEHDCRLQVLHGRQYFRNRSGAPLQKLVRQHPADCWVLLRASPEAQAWFARQKVSAVVAGSCYPEVDLPFVDIDHRALCRHAAGVLLALGHRRIALIAEQTHRAGDVASELGFIEGVRTSRHAEAEPLVVWHRPSVDSVAAAVRRLMEGGQRPTALLVANPFFYLTVTSRLAQLGLKVPTDVSVLSRDEDPFLSFLLPQPARYSIPAHGFARKLLRPILEAIESGTVRTRAVSITPDYVAGDSVARVAVRMA